FRMHVPKRLVPALRSLSGVSVLLAALENPDEKWFGKNPTAARDEVVRSTFERAVARLRKRSAEAGELTWGKLHTVTYRHPLGTLGPEYDKAFSFAPLERPGDANTPNNARYDESYRQVHGPTYRHLFDLADWDRGLATSAPGQSGQPGSPHYGDLLPLWDRGEYFPLAFSRAKVEKMTQHRLWLRPSEK